MDDREFWMLVRAALLMWVKAIERRWGLKPAKDSRGASIDTAVHDVVPFKS